ncbi:ATP-binding cassette domain-containing protein [Spiroplasma sp. BIUS-1]|uniref:ATP-binding cassette domain-containing protein n=1 Tax=Spiroplasma sp. BIUS-1 TaxID=216964 RepID=UPI0013A6F03D|nr:ATP-binding cassette domain-containing protein [Spiroplasma sp. BIUS-1]
MEYKFSQQQSLNDCGIAVTTMLINYFHKKDFGVEEVKFENYLGDEMLNLYDIEQVLQKYKINFESYSCSFEELVQIDISNPIVLNVVNKNNLEHFIIVYKKKKDMFLIADPNEKDLKWLKFEEVEKIYQGYLSTTKVLEKIDFKNKNLYNWFYFVKNFKLEVGLIFLISILLNVLILISNNFIKIYMENINLNDSKNMQLIFNVYIFIFFVQIFSSYYINKIIYKIKNKISKNIFHFYKEKLLSLTIEKFNTNSKEEWTKKLSHINIVSEFITDSIINLPLGFTLFFMFSIFLLLISPFILTLVLIQNLISICMSVVIFYLIKEFKIKKERKLIDFSLNYRQILEAYEEIKYKNIETEINRVNNKNYNETFDVNKKIFNLNNSSEVMLTVVNKLFFYLIFYVSVTHINKGSFTFADLLFYTSISSYINIFFNNVTGYILNIQEIIIASKSLSFVFESNKLEDNLEKINTIKSIEVNSLYKYKSDNCLLNNFNFVFDQNTFVHGKSGSGKTTLLKILSGHFKNYEGEILIDNIELKNIENDSYSKKIIYLGQYDYLFDGTVWQNIQQFKNEVDFNVFEELRLNEVLERNNIALDKKIHDNGYNLSKGQRQIINFISLFFTQKDVYLIDEPLSNVDKHTAYYLFKTFVEYKKDSLIIMCDHDMAYCNFFEKRVEVV